MESTKIRALTQLCLELKQRRETLIEQWSSTQSYLDTKQQSLEHEFRALQQDNQMLFNNVEHLQKALGGFHSDWKDYLQQMLGLQRELRQLGGDYQQLQQDFGGLHTEMRLIQQNISQHTESDDEAKQAFEDLEIRLQQQTHELQASYEKYQSQQNLLEKMYQQKSVQSEHVDAVKIELSALQGHFQQLGTDVKQIYTEIEAYKIRWQADHEAQQNAMGHLRTAHDALSEQHQELEQQYADLQALQAQKEVEYSASLVRHTAYQAEIESLSQESVTALSALRGEHDRLQADTQALLSALKDLESSWTSRWTGAQAAQHTLEAAFVEQEAKFAAQQEKFAELEAQGAAHLSRVHALEAENKGYEEDLYELSDLVDTQKQQLETQQSDHEAKLAALNEAQDADQEAHKQHLAELQSSSETQRSEYESKLAALESSQRSQQSEYEAKLIALSEAQSETQESHENERSELASQLAALELSQSSQQSEYEAKLAALTEAQSLAQESHHNQLAELQAAQQRQQSEYETQIAALIAAQALAKENHELQLAEYAQQAEADQAKWAGYAEQQQAAEAQLAQQQQRLQGYNQGLRDIQEAYAQLVHQAQQSADATAPLQEALDDIHERLEASQEKDSEQKTAIQSTQETLADARAEHDRKQKLLAQLENYGEESETLKSAREELLQEIDQNTQRTEALAQTLAELETTQNALTEEKQTLQTQLVKKQQDLQLAEQEMRQRQEQAEQLQAFIDAFGESDDGGTTAYSVATTSDAAETLGASAVNDPLNRALEAKVKILEADKARLLDQISVQEGELLKQSQELERLEHQDILAPLEQGSQPHLDQVISEEVAQISSLLSELNFGGDAELDHEAGDDDLSEAFPVFNMLEEDDPEPVSPPPAEPSKATSQLPTVYVYTQKVLPTADLRAQLADYLAQYRHQVLWIERPEQLQSSGAKGVIFLLTPEEKVDTAALQQVKRSKVAHIEHVMSNITRLKIAVLDAFIG